MNRIIALTVTIGLTALASADFKPTSGPESPDGKARVAADLPQELRMHNTGGMGRGGPGTGAGLCVFTSGEHAARLQNERLLNGLQKYMTTRPGGGYPQKVDAVFKAFAPGLNYVQHTGGDVTFLELALKTGRMPCVTYNGRDDFYRGPIAHMVNLVYLDETRAAILDNNREHFYVWMTRAEFLSRWKGGSGWAYVLLSDPPPPVLNQ